MILTMKQQNFAWTNNYEVYNEQGEVAYRIQGKPGWAFKLEVYDKTENVLGSLSLTVSGFSFVVTFDIGGEVVGTLTYKHALFKEVIDLDMNGWQIEKNDWFGFQRTIFDDAGVVMFCNRKKIALVDTYCLDIADENEAVPCLLIAVGLDAISDMIHRQNN